MDANKLRKQKQKTALITGIEVYGVVMLINALRYLSGGWTRVCLVITIVLCSLFYLLYLLVINPFSPKSTLTKSRE